MPSGSPRPFRPWSKRKPRLYGSPPLPLPIVATVGIGGITEFTTTIIGSFNPQGLSGACWFVYGTTPQFGLQSETVEVAAISTPTTQTATLTGLSTGVEYWVAIVGQTAGGTVTAAPLQFTPVALPLVTNASQPLTPIGTPAVAIPHFQFPFTMTPTGALVCEQDSLEEIYSNVQTVVACPIGACPELPTFGIPDPTFQPGPPDANGMVSAIQLWEPRANETAVVRVLDNTNANWGVSLTTRATGTAQ